MLTLICGTLICGILIRDPAAAAGQSDPYAPKRFDMVEKVKQRGITEESILSAMERVPRHRFVPEFLENRVYDDDPVSISPGHTLPQAYISAQMIELLDLDGDEKVLEIGTGTGYDAALLSRVAGEVYSIEIDGAVARQAGETLRELGYTNVHVRQGDGFDGWPKEAPFDAILVTAAPDKIPETLYEQLAVGGKMVLAVGGLVQDLQVVTKTKTGREVRRILPVVLGPMINPDRRD